MGEADEGESGEKISIVEEVTVEEMVNRLVEIYSSKLVKLFELSKISIKLNHAWIRIKDQMKTMKFDLIIIILIIGKLIKRFFL